MSQNALLATIEWLLVNQEHRIHQFAVRRLHAILSIQVERIYDALFACGLNHVSRPQCSAKGQVILHGDAMPVIELERGKSGIVITMPQTGTRKDVVRDLT